MDERKIIEVLRDAGEPAMYRQEGCLPPERLAAYQDGELCEGERAEAEAHLADCDYCLEQLAAIVHSQETASPHSDSASVPPALVAKAERLFTPARRQPAAVASRWAMAAVVVLAIGLFALQYIPPTAPATPVAERQTRFADPQPLQPQLLAPAEGSVNRPLEQVFRWTEVPGSLFYDVRLVNSDGDLLLRERVDGVRWLIPVHLERQAGEEYFVRVDAYLSDAKYLSSEHVVFTVSRPN